MGMVDTTSVAKKVPGQSPGYWTAEQGWVFTGCAKHDEDPCGACDGE